MILFVLSACGGLTYWGDDLARLGVDTTDSGTTDPDGGGGGGGGGGDFVIETVSPNFGSNAGGTEVVIAGQFDDVVDVSFNGLDADVIERSATEITVLTPSTTAVGWVDVTVSRGGKSASIDPGFQYFNDASGQAGAYGYAEYFHMVGDYWQGGPSDFAWADFGFMEPGEWDMRAVYSPTLDTCVAWEFEIVPPPLIDTGASRWDLVGTGATVPLDADDTIGGLFTNPDAVATLEPGQTYDLEGSPASGDWPVYDLPDAVTIPDPFTVLTPDMDAVNEPLVSRFGFNVTWDGNGGDYVAIWLQRRQAGGTRTIVSCSAKDDGAFLIPGGTWPDWFAGEFIDVQVGRVIEAGTPLPHDNSENRIAGSYWYYGAVITN